mmetsp:Transcript_20682/g.26773  ORF Transcript_20682/g.26773 Transcript_20682/m.26773 type:complete len:217 (-) Transcript_20682:228-878(-)
MSTSFRVCRRLSLQILLVYCFILPLSNSLFFGKRQSRKSLKATCDRLEREINEAALAERILIEQLRQMRSTSSELREALRKSTEENEKIVANATAYAKLLEEEVVNLKKLLAETQATSQKAQAESQLLKASLQTSEAELESLKRDLIRAKKALVAERNKLRERDAGGSSNTTRSTRTTTTVQKKRQRTEQIAPTSTRSSTRSTSAPSATPQKNAVH